MSFILRVFLTVITTLFMEIDIAVKKSIIPEISMEISWIFYGKYTIPLFPNQYF